MNQGLENIELSMLWPTVLIKSMFLGGLDGMRAEVYRLNSIPNAIKKSNYGGWQSDIYLHENAAFAPLCKHVASICSRLFKVKGAKFHQMWACINRKNDQNLIHSHTNNYNLSGVFYLMAPVDCGEIVFRDPRPGANSAPYRLFKDDGDSEYFTPVEGQIIMFPSYLEHFVLPNKSEGDRMSMSFDLTLEK